MDITKRNRRIAMVVFLISTVLMLGVYIYSDLSVSMSVKRGLLGGLWIIPTVPFILIWIFSCLFLVTSLKRKTTDVVGDITFKKIFKVVVSLIIFWLLMYMWVVKS